MHIACVGIDLGKTPFTRSHWESATRSRFARSPPQTLLAYTANLPASLIGLEACAGTHFVGTALQVQGHRVRLVPTQFVKTLSQIE